MSLQKQLLLWILIILLGVATLAGGFAFWRTYDDLNKLQRNNLKNIAMLFASAPRPPRIEERGGNREQSRTDRAFDTQESMSQLGSREGNREGDRDGNSDSYRPTHKPDYKPEEILNHQIEGLAMDTLDKMDNRMLAETSEMSQYDSKESGQIRVHVIPLPLTRLNPNHLKRLQERHLLDLPEGVGKIKIKEEEWQSFRINQPERIIIVRQKASLQERLAIIGGLQAFVPVLLALLALMGLLPVVINKMFRPVRVLSRQVANRDEQDFSPIDTLADGTRVPMPTEIQPLITETNQLLVRINKHIRRQQRFIADAAHELRSPLTAISLQVQRLQRLANPSKTEPDITPQQLVNLRSGIDKLSVRVSHNQHLVEQLLTLARVDAQQLQSSKSDLMPVLTQAVMLLLPIADNKQIELEVDNQLDGTENQVLSEQVNLDETSLMMLLKNLLQNAILYTPEQGKVMVSIKDSHTLVNTQAHLTQNSECKLVGIITDKSIDDLSRQPKRLVIQICDTGIGIAVQRYQEVFTPFVRIGNNADATRSDTAIMQGVESKGTGLGLAIVKQICQQAGIDIYLSAGREHLKTKSTLHNKGLTVTLVFA